MKKPTFFGKYLLLERLNVGGMAEVFIAKAFGVEGFERILAIKKILPTMAEDEEFIKMFIDEARISVQLNHANVVHIHELGKYQEAFYIAMEYVAGRDVRTLLERYRRRKEIMPTAQAVFIASKMCEGLDYAHRKKDARGQELSIIHRDVSPQNILVSYEGEVKIIDFGIAKAANRSQQTQAGILKGKFGYMSPEQVRGMATDRRSDIFALGIILYEMLTGEKLFVGESDYSTLEHVRNAEVPLPRQFNPDIPGGLERVLLKALAREPEDRYQWASDLQEDLMRFLLAGDQIYSSKHLAGFMKEAFAEELLREAERMERFAAVERPEHIENSGITANAVRAPRRSSSAVTSSGGNARGQEDSLVAPVDNTDSQPVVVGEQTQIVDPLLSETDGETGRTNESLLPFGEESTSLSSATLQRRPKGQIVIGEGAAFSGATLVGPAPSEGVGSGATQIGPLPDEQEEGGVRSEPTRIGPEALEPEPPTVVPQLSLASSTGAAPLPSPSIPVEKKGERPVPEKRPRPLSREGLSTRGRLVWVGLAAVLLLGLATWWFREEKTAGLMVTVRPTQGAVLHVDGRPLSLGSVASLAPGRHHVQAEVPGHRSVQREVEVVAGARPLVLNLVLEPLLPGERQSLDSGQAQVEPVDGGTSGGVDGGIPGEVRGVLSGPASLTFKAVFQGVAGAEVRVEGRWVGRTPKASLGELTVGRDYAFTVRRAGYKPFSGHFRAERPGEAEVAFVLEKEGRRKPVEPRRLAEVPATREKPEPEKISVAESQGQLACSTKPAGAQIWVDGRNTGRETPVALSNPLLLPVGARQVVFRLHGKQSKPVTVAIKENEVTKLLNVSIE